MTFWDFLATRNAGDIIRLIEGVVGIVAAVLSGAALRNVLGLKKMIGTPIERTLGQVIRGLFRRGPKHGRSTPATVLDKPLTVEQQIEGLKELTERLWVQQGLAVKHIEQRLDRVDPPTRKH